MYIIYEMNFQDDLKLVSLSHSGNHFRGDGPHIFHMHITSKIWDTKGTIIAQILWYISIILAILMIVTTLFNEV